jgi:hypothetical protein
MQGLNQGQEPGEPGRAADIYGEECPLPTLLNHLAMPGCTKIKSQWDRCGVYYVKSNRTARTLTARTRAYWSQKLHFPAALREDACRHRQSLCASCPAWSGQQDLNLRQPIDPARCRSDRSRPHRALALGRAGPQSGFYHPLRSGCRWPCGSTNIRRYAGSLVCRAKRPSRKHHLSLTYGVISEWPSARIGFPQTLAEDFKLLLDQSH